MFYREKAYTRINWKNRPNLSTPLGAKNLNKMDATLNELDDRIIEVSSEVEQNRLNIVLMSGEINALEENVAQNTSQIEKISNLAEDVNGLKIVNTASGTTAYIDDASNMNIENIIFYGESKQMQTTGKNLFGFEKSAIDVTEELRKLANQRLIFAKINDNSIKCNYSGGTYATGFVELNGVDGTKNYAFSFVVKNNTLGFTPRIEKYTQECTSEKLVLTIYSGSGATEVSSNEYFILENIQVEEGTTVTPYEPYSNRVASPSPDYPQPIESKTVNRVDVMGGQFLDLQANTSSSASGLSISIQDGYIITVSGTPSETWANFSDYDTKKIPQGRYTFSIDKSPTELGVGKICIKFRKSMSESTILTHQITGSNKSITFDRLNDYELIQIYADGIDTSTNYNFTIKVMLNAGETALPFEPYQSQTVNLSAPIELNGIGGVRDTDKVKKFGVVVFDGSDDEGWRADTTNNTSNDGKYRNRTDYLKNSTKYYDIADTANLLCTHYKAVPSNSAGTWGKHEGMCIDNGGGIMVYDENFNTADISLWKAHLQANPMTVVYELAEPIETELPIVDQTAIKQLHTYKPNTVVMNDADAEMDVKYVSDVKIYIDRKFEALASAIVNQ